MFNQQELQILLGGVNSPIDLDDLRSHTQYGGLYDDHESTIQIFWRVSRLVVARIVQDLILSARSSTLLPKTNDGCCCVSLPAVVGRLCCKLATALCTPSFRC